MKTTDKLRLGYLFSSLGFYPVCPGSDQYVIDSTLFNKITVYLENGKKIEMKAPNNSSGTRYVSDIKVNGKKYTRNYFTHKQLINGAKIEFNMTDTPKKSRGTKKSDFPYSFSNENPQLKQKSYNQIECKSSARENLTALLHDTLKSQR